MVRGIAAVAEQEDVLALAGVAYGARMRGLLRLVLGILSKPLAGVELGDLPLVLYLDAFDCRACVENVLVCGQTKKSACCNKKAPAGASKGLWW